MPPDIVERMKEALRPFAACAKGMTLSDTTHTSTLPADYFRRARAVLAKAENLGKPVLYPAVPATDEWPGRGPYLVIPVLDQPEEPV
jgi:hypothetical protein